MKMTPLLWRIVSVWLCVAVVSRYPSCYVGCTESHQEPERPVSSQDFSSEEELVQNTPDHKVEEHSVLAAQLSGNELLLEDTQQNDEQTTQDKDTQQSEAFEEKGLDVEEEVVAEEDSLQTQPETQPSSENLNDDSSVVQEQDSDELVPSSEPVSGFTAEPKDNPDILDLQENIPNGVLDDSPNVDVSEVTEVDLPPSVCEEQENNTYESESSPPTVLENSSSYTTGSNGLTDPSLTPATQHIDAYKSHMVKEQDQSSPATTDTDSSVSSKDPEDIPTFDEWKRKVMEVEKEKTLFPHTSNNGGSQTLKKTQKNFNNYASVECGAKILGANQEAKSTSAILKENMDLYMLNPCSNKIWFVIELCEPIQVKQLDIANFELFSSTPKDFLVSISDRYPTNKWLKLGTFHARDERTVQSFPLDEHLYAKYVKIFTKYIKVELVSHFGSEHFCPLSLIRVFGTSMVEEYDEITDPPERPDDQDDEQDYPGYPGEVKSKNLIGSAKEVILKMVNDIAVNVLGGNPDMQANISSHQVNMTDPSAEIDTTTQTPTTDVISDPDTEEAELLPDSGIPEIEAPSTETPPSEMPDDTDVGKQELPPVDEISIDTEEKDEEKPISSMITLLDKEEELDEEKEIMDRHEQQQQNHQNYCALLSSSCSSTVSLMEYLVQQSSALLSKKRKCQPSDRNQNILPIIPTWHHSEVQQLHENEQASAEPQPESGASPSESPLPPGNTVDSHKESVSDPPVLEPSQTSSLLEPSATDSSAITPTPPVETPQPPYEETVKEQRPEQSLDVLATEKNNELSVSLSSSVDVKPSSTIYDTSAEITDEEEKPNVDVSQSELSTPVQIPDKTYQSEVVLPTTSVPLEHHPDPPSVPKSSTDPTELSQPTPDTVTELEPSSGPSVIAETKTEDFMENISSSNGNGQLPHPSSPLPTPPSPLDIYAETPNGTEQNGNQVHGSSQKESVFMRLNNRIKALEVNMSLSGRYLEQLSQRYRKQMEEMQKAFNKTVIKLQNTSTIAEEQDLRQTESIQLLQGQLENVTQLVLNLSVKVSQLQSEVSDRQNYLLLSLLLCLCLGLLLFTNHYRITTIPPVTQPKPPIAKTYNYCCPERQLSSCKETGLKKSASYPLINSESFQLAAAEGPEMLHADETQSLCLGNRKRRRRKLKPIDKVETLKASFHAASELRNGTVVCNGVPVTTKPAPLTKMFLQPIFRDSVSEGSSEGSSHSDDPSFCGITTACPRICDGIPLHKTRAQKRAFRRRRLKPSCAIVDLLQVPQRDKREPLSICTIEGLMDGNTEKSSGTFGANVALSGPV